MDSLRLIILLLSTTLSFYLLQTLIRLLHKVWWTPIKLQAAMSSQGVRGPPYRFPHGNIKEIFQMRIQSMDKPMDISHDIFPRIYPHVYAWTKAYGKNFLSWHGSECRLFVTEPELIKEILMNKDGAFPIMDTEGILKKVYGESLPANEGEKWAKVRRLANHTFHAENLKDMVPEMLSSVVKMLERWKGYEGKEIDVFKEFKVLTTEAISRTAFGSSYCDGNHISEMGAKLTAIYVRNAYKFQFPGIGMLMKSDDEVEAERLAKKIKSSILEIVKKRENAREFGNDYLGQLVKAAHESDAKKRITVDQMIDEIRILYRAGHTTTTSLLGWCVFLLAINTEWQDKARVEVKMAFGKNSPDSGGVAKLKIMNMIINECLRLYPPVTQVARKVAKEVKISNILARPKMNVYIPVLALHHNPQLWGEDVHLFRPERFSEGVAKATYNDSTVFLPFGFGPRNCIGSNFATIEAKIALSMILQKYKFVLSPNYVHYPAEVFILIPKMGVQVILKAI